MGDSAVIELPGGARTVSLADLEHIQSALAHVLRNKQPAVDYFHLVDELENRSAAMFPADGGPRIGQWQLIVRDGQALMERQQFPRAPLMRFFEAPLSLEDGRWKVTDVRIRKVRGR